MRVESLVPDFGLWAVRRMSGDDGDMAVLDHKTCGALLDLGDVKRALGLVEQSFLGLQPIPVDHIVGTVGRPCDFDRCFHPLRPELRRRMARVQQAFPDGGYPTISVFQVDQAYFVADGHHRVALARRLGAEYIDAQITQIHGPYRLGPDVDSAQIELTGHERTFLKLSGLAAARPAARIACSSATSYAELLEAVKAHGYDLMRQCQCWVPSELVAASWYDCVYRPTLETAESTGLSDLLPSCNDGDIFLCLHRSHRSAFGAECNAAEDAILQAAEANRDYLTSRQPRLVYRLTHPQRPPPPLLPRRY